MYASVYLEPLKMRSGKKAPLTFAHTSMVPFVPQQMSEISVLHKVVALWFVIFSLFKYTTFKVTCKWELSFYMWKILWKKKAEYNVLCFISLSTFKKILEQQIITKWGSSLKVSSPSPPPKKKKLMGEKRYVLKVWSTQEELIVRWVMLKSERVEWFSQVTRSEN